MTARKFWYQIGFNRHIIDRDDYTITVLLDQREKYSC